MAKFGNQDWRSGTRQSDGSYVQDVATGAAAGAGAVNATTQRVTLASDDPAVASLSALDDWDESDRAKVNPIVGQAGVAAGSGAADAKTQRVILASDSRSVAANAGGIPAGAATYTAVIAGYTAYATPTDLVTISGSGTKTVAVTVLAIGAQATAANVQAFFWLKRSTANSGGSSTAATAVPHDSTNAAATASVVQWDSAPTTGTTVGKIGLSAATSVQATTAQVSPTNFPTIGAATGALATSMVGDMRQPIILRGTGEVLALNFNGAALPAGFTSTIIVQWIEY